MERNRTEFVSEVLAGEKNMSQLCRAYGVSRKTGYKWLNRAQNGETLNNRSHRPKSPAQKTAVEIERLILEERQRHPEWGARKLKRYLENKGHHDLPAQSTICAILKRNGCITPEESQAHTAYQRFEKETPNEMWQMDFKGDFALLNATRCHPLTILDDHSRFCLCLEAMENQQGVGTFAKLRRVFFEYGLPDSILSDNGPPWGDSKSGGITQFDVWMMQLGILPIHGRPIHPQTQGKEERFHRTLKAEVLKRELFADHSAAQQRLDQWRDEYNFERPHGALDLNTPATRYSASARKLPEALCEPEYEPGRTLRKVNYKGYISIQSHRYYIGEALAGKLLESSPVNKVEVALFYGQFRVAKINLSERIFTSRHIYLRDTARRR